MGGAGQPKDKMNEAKRTEYSELDDGIKELREVARIDNKRVNTRESKPKPNFYSELEKLINRYSKENESDTPDFILARYLSRCLDNFALTVRDREQWHGRGSYKDYALDLPSEK